MRAPITAEKIHGMFSIGDSELTAQQEAELAAEIDYIVSRDIGGSAVWFTENDHAEAKARGEVLKVDDQTVHYLLPNETLAFPNYQSPALYTGPSRAIPESNDLLPAA